MSGSFHHIMGEGRSLWWHLKRDTLERDRPVTGEPVADAIGAVLRAIGPIEEAVAYHQDCDAGIESVMIACVESGAALEAACGHLIMQVQLYRHAVAGIVRNASIDKEESA